MFVPGYAVKGGFIDEAPGLISVLGTAGGQMFFSLSLAMGAILTYGSYLGKEENLVSNSITIVAADTLIAIMAGVAVIPAAVANGINNGIPVNEIAMNGPKLLFVTLQDVFANMGKAGPLFGVIFYLLVLLAAISSAISLMEAVGAHWIDMDLKAGKGDTRKRITLTVSALITIAALIVAVDGLGSNNIHPAALMGITGPDGELLPAEELNRVMGSVLTFENAAQAKALQDQHMAGYKSTFFARFYTVCIRFVAPVVMAFVLAGQMIVFFGGHEVLWYAVAFGTLALSAIYTLSGREKK